MVLVIKLGDRCILWLRPEQYRLIFWSEQLGTAIGVFNAMTGVPFFVGSATAAASALLLYVRK